MSNKTSVQLFNDFIENEKNMDEIIKQILSKDKSFKIYEETKLVGFLNSLDYKNAIVCTHENFLRNVEGCPKHTYLIGVLNDVISNTEKQSKKEFIILEVMEATINPNQNEMNITQFEIFKKVLPSLDPYTQNELSWKALNCKIIGTFYQEKKDPDNFTYSYDNSNLFAPISYKIFKPNKELLNVILNNHFIKNKNNTVPAVIGYYRPTENLSYLEDHPESKTNVLADLNDFIGKRTALFGKTRLGKSNTLKLLALNMIKNKMNVGQLIFDINGEYANDNEQDGGKSLASMFKEDVSIYAIKPRKGTNAKVLKINFYKEAEKGISILKDMLKKENIVSQNATGFYSVEIKSIDKIRSYFVEKNSILFNKHMNKHLMYVAILYKAGFRDPPKDTELKYKLRLQPDVFKAYKSIFHQNEKWTLDMLMTELSLICNFLTLQKKGNPNINHNGLPVFDQEDLALLDFYQPSNSAGGTKVITKYKEFHSSQATDFTKTIINDLIDKKTIILDLGNTEEHLRQYFSDYICAAIFQYQEDCFTQNNLDTYIQFYFEEAHNIFPRDKSSVRDIYSKIAKEGAKFKMGIVYSTQSPSTVSGELLAQTENFFVGHISSKDEVNSLIKIESHFENHSEEISAIKTKGYMRMYTASHRYVIPVQIKLFNEED